MPSTTELSDAPRQQPRRNASEQQTDVSKQIWLNGELLPADQAKVSVYDHGLLYGDGVFEGIRVYNGRVFKLDTHLHRLYDSARAIRLNIPYDPRQLADAVRQTVKANQRADCYIRLCVSRGAGTLGVNPFVCARPNVFIIVDSIALYPKELYDKGLPVITSSIIRNHPSALNPRIKSLNYLNNILAKIEAIDAGVLEAVMLNHNGYVAECTGDNIFIVRQRAGLPALLTPPLHAGVLEGVTRNVVIDLARRAGMDVAETDLTRHDLYTADEMFLTGTAAEVVPVTAMDKRTIGDGQPGPVTKKLNQAFRDLVRENAPED
jgi:branched-chain amino acid aminotransferase